MFDHTHTVVQTNLLLFFLSPEEHYYDPQSGEEYLSRKIKNINRNEVNQVSHFVEG